MASPPRPTAAGRRQVNKLKFSEIMAVLPCLFNLPIKKLQRLLNSSHGTLSKARREHGLDRWPYESIIQGRFKMSWDDVDSLLRETISKSDERIAGYLTLIHEEAVKHAKYNLQAKDPAVPNPTAHQKVNSPVIAALMKNEEPALLAEDDEDPGDYYLRMALQEDPVIAPTEDVDRDSYWKGLYDLLDPDRIPVEPASPSLLGY